MGVSTQTVWDTEFMLQTNLHLRRGLRVCIVCAFTRSDKNRFKESIHYVCVALALFSRKEGKGLISPGGNNNWRTGKSAAKQQSKSLPAFNPMPCSPFVCWSRRRPRWASVFLLLLLLVVPRPGIVVCGSFRSSCFPSSQQSARTNKSMNLHTSTYPQCVRVPAAAVPMII